MDKSQGRALHGELFEAWQQRPAEFELDGHAPVRELWRRASAAWGAVLGHPAVASAALVVAHNATNQALICTALGLPPSAFRRLTQTNAAHTVLDFAWPPAPGAAPAVRVARFNQFPEPPLRRDRLGRATVDRLVLVCGSAGSPQVGAALRLLAAGGVGAAPLVAVGPPAGQAADVASALAATLATPRAGEGRSVLAVAAPGACRALVGLCLGGGGLGAAAEGVGAAFDMDEGGITIVNYRATDDLAAGTLLCANLDPEQTPAGDEG
jgi:probable phosphoglycerate mutase